MDTSELISVLIQSVPTLPASALVQQCHDWGMTPQPYQPSPADGNLPEFDAGHQFRFESRGSTAAGFDVLEKEGAILQAGFQIFFPRGLFVSKSKMHLDNMVNLIEQHYGSGQPTQASGMTILNYGDSQTVCYISKAKVLGKDLITVRVGNRVFWG